MSILNHSLHQPQGTPKFQQGITTTSFPLFCSSFLFTKIRTMEGRLALLFLFVLGAAWACDARELAKRDQLRKLSKKPDVCALCEEYTAKALDYLNEKKTQQEIIDILHKTCHHLRPFNQKCITLVDYYAPLFFLEIATIQPGEFCHKINICHLISYISSQVQKDSCGFCKDTVSTLLAKLKDNDTKLEMIGTTLKVCNSVEKYADKCTRMVLEYGPLVFDNAEKFLESTDMCTAIYALQIFNSGWPTSLPLRLLWKQRSNRFVVDLLQKIAIYMTTH